MILSEKQRVRVAMDSMVGQLVAAGLPESIAKQEARAAALRYDEQRKAERRLGRSRHGKMTN